MRTAKAEYTFTEELLHAGSHGAGVILSIGGLAWMLYLAIDATDPWRIVASCSLPWSGTCSLSCRPLLSPDRRHFAVPGLRIPQPEVGFYLADLALPVYGADCANRWVQS